MISTNSFLWRDFSIEMTRTYLNIVLTRFLGCVSLIIRLEVSFLFVMIKHVGGILVGRKQPPKSFSVVCIGLPYSKTPTCIGKAALGVNSLVKSVGEI